ncbi:hypothetical protein [Paraburkholderia sacchari]|uniref:hypothetical protein n=1 Tax=Paraburkholderia sacchari TaxID=159450 RepID=UPI001BCC84D8|nr:hypothetical protein [Paraburkholderia sacchari]
MSATKQWNPRFAAYAASRGMTPEQASAADRITYPGGRFAGFVVWNSQRIREFLQETGEHRSVTTHFGLYDAWLARRFVRGQLELSLEVA